MVDLERALRSLVKEYNALRDEEKKEILIRQNIYRKEVLDFFNKKGIRVLTDEGINSKGSYYLIYLDDYFNLIEKGEEIQSRRKKSKSTNLYYNTNETQYFRFVDLPKDKQQEIIYRGIIEYISHRKISNILLTGSEDNKKSIYNELSSKTEIKSIILSIEKSSDLVKETSSYDWIIDTDELVGLYNRGMVR